MDPYAAKYIKAARVARVDLSDFYRIIILGKLTRIDACGAGRNNTPRHHRK